MSELNCNDCRHAAKKIILITETRICTHPARYYEPIVLERGRFLESVCGPAGKNFQPRLIRFVEEKNAAYYYSDLWC